MLTRNLLKQVDRYLDGRCTLQQLEQWLLLNLQAILDSGDQHAIGLANELDALFIDATEEPIPSTEMKSRLRTLTRHAEREPLR